MDRRRPTTESTGVPAHTGADSPSIPSLHLDRDFVAQTSVGERLAQLEEQIVTAVKRDLCFDHFEIRLRSPGSQRLELVISENLSPMRIGESISACETGNGISGWVAATGQSYLCGDVRRDALYREGLDDARSSLTVPLLVHERVIGVFNIESNTVDAFTEADQVLAKRYAAVIASALHVLDLLVVERSSTCQHVTRSMSSELERPITELQDLAGALVREGDTITADRLQRIVTDMTNRISACAAGPRSIIDAEHELHAIEPDAALAGLRVLVVDDEARLLAEVTAILEKLGCVPMPCANGGEAFAALDRMHEHDGFAMVLSDIRLPDASGYEVFSKTREIMPDVPVILMTGFGYDPDHTIVRASADGVQGILLKPFRTSQLIEAIRHALHVEPSGRTA